MTNLEHPSRKLTLEKNWINVIHALCGYWLGGRTSAADSRESARIRADSAPPGSARIRRTSAKNIFRRTPPNVRRTFGGNRRTPRGYGRIRADSAANWRKSSLEKCPPTKTSLTPRFPAEKLPPRMSFRRGNNSRVRVRVRVRVMVL